MALVEVQGIAHSYPLGVRTVQALRGIDMRVEKGEFTALAGPSGSGKTTLLNIMGLLEPPHTGKVCFDGVDVSETSETRRTLLRRNRIGFIFQTFNLIQVLSAYENVEYCLLKRSIHAGELSKRVAETLAMVGLSDQAEQRPNQMSGGQQQRVAIARAFARDVDLIIADEPTAALDQDSARAIMDLMKWLCREREVTFIIASHDPKMLAFADRVVRMEDGRLVG